ncbi:hypothetical protein ACS4JF_18860 [Bacillus thuringiensis]|nr:hypothetical protein [Bacillus thuringiensis]MDM8365651.1 hypothetical protein [Bacillus thuringiensis]
MQFNEKTIKELIKLANLEKFSELIEICMKYETNSTMDTSNN